MLHFPPLAPSAPTTGSVSLPAMEPDHLVECRADGQADFQVSTGHVAGAELRGIPGVVNVQDALYADDFRLAIV